MGGGGGVVGRRSPRISQRAVTKSHLGEPPSELRAGGQTGLRLWALVVILITFAARESIAVALWLEGDTESGRGLCDAG